MNDFGSWAQGPTNYEQLKVVVDINNSELWAQASTCYEKTQGGKWYERFYMMSSKLWMTSTTPAHELSILDIMNN